MQVVCSKSYKLQQEEDGNSETEVTYLNRTFLKSNMKAKRYKPARTQDTRTKAFQNGGTTRVYMKVSMY